MKIQLVEIRSDYAGFSRLIALAAQTIESLKKGEIKLMEETLP